MKTIYKTTEYAVTVVHPTGHHTGTHVFDVCTETRNGKTSWHVKGLGFGCSRDYWFTDDENAIREFMMEHGCKVTKIVKQ
jgi:hypothetical protein